MSLWHLVLLIIVIVVLITVTYFIINNFLKKVTLKVTTEVQEKKAAYLAIRTLMYAEMNALLKKCNTAGYTTEEDRQIFAALHDVYGQLGGNHDAIERRATFYSLPYFEAARRDRPELIYRQMNQDGEWIFDVDIENDKLPHSIMREREVKTSK